MSADRRRPGSRAPLLLLAALVLVPPGTAAAGRPAGRQVRELRGYIDDLLDHGTRVLASAGAEVIKASTDRANSPMAAAFHRRGYPTAGETIDYNFPSGR